MISFMIQEILKLCIPIIEQVAVRLNKQLAVRIKPSKENDC